MPLPPSAHLREYIHYFLAQDEGAEGAAEATAPGKKEQAPPATPRALRPGCWLDRAQEKAFLQHALANYERAAAQSSAPAAAAIPRVLHHIWLGSAFPAHFQRLRAAWLAHHPVENGTLGVVIRRAPLQPTHAPPPIPSGWAHRLWTDAEVAPLVDGLRNRAAYLAAPNYGQKADILRYELLERYGGVYVDVDMECLQPLDPLLEAGGLTLVTGFSNTGTVELNNGLIGYVVVAGWGLHTRFPHSSLPTHHRSTPHHPVLEALIARIHGQQQQEDRQAQPKQPVAPSPPPPPAPPSWPAMLPNMAAIMGFLGQTDVVAVTKAVVATASDEQHRAAMSTIEATGPGLFTRVVAAHLQGQGADGILLAPPPFFYPVPNNVPISERYVLPGVSYALHHWARSWQQGSQ